MMMMMQLPSKRRFKTPGPGTYNATLHPVAPTPPAFTIAGKASGEYDLQILDWEPGPGTYSAAAHRTRSSHGPFITIASRIATSSSSSASAAKYSSDAPGPGAYNVSERTTALTRRRDPAYSIASRTYTFHREISPGPGAYTIVSSSSDTYGAGPAFSIATRLKSKLHELGRLSDSPGPGSYNSAAAADHQRPRSPIIYIGGGGRRKIVGNAEVPGPGAYSQHKPPHGRTFTISGRRPARLVEETPGPGQYCADAAEPLVHPSEPMVSIAGRLSVNAAAAAGGVGGSGSGNGSDPTPGPGAYEPRRKATAPAFTIVGRPHDRRPAPFVATHVAGAGGDNPGPGAYFTTQPGKGGGNLNHVIGVSAPAIKIAGKNYPPPGSPIPGPGAYSPRYVAEGGGGGGFEKRGITIATKLNACGNGSQSAALVSTATENSPGPGNYFWDNKYYSNVSSPAISMGVRFPVPRGSSGSGGGAGDAGPGPGSYNVARPRGGPAFSIHSGSERYSFT